MNPPIRSAGDRAALLEGIADGTIDMIATDHAPHAAEEKAGGLRRSLMGVPGLESAFAACVTALVEPGVIPLERLAALMSVNPSRRFSLPGRNGITAGAPADLTVADVTRRGVFDAQQTYTQSKRSPFDGLTLTGRRLRHDCKRRNCMERILTILENTPLAPGVFRLLLDGAEADDVRAPGQFFNLSVDGFYLRRPISVCDAAGSRVTLIYKVVGAGTRALSDYRPGRTLRVLTALGNGYDLTETGSHPLLLGGGAGVPPMYLLAKALLARGVPARRWCSASTPRPRCFTKPSSKSLGVPTGRRHGRRRAACPASSPTRRRASHTTTPLPAGLSRC